MGSFNMANIKKTIYYLKRNGVRNTWYAAKERVERNKSVPYRFTGASEGDLDKQREWSKGRKLLISIVVPTYRTNEKYLRELIESVQAQTYPEWELVLADATEDESVESIAGLYNDSRINYIRLGENKGISENTVKGLESAHGEYTGLLDHDDLIEPDLLYEVVKAVEEAKRDGIELEMLYTDEDKCNGDATVFYEPNYKEKFNYDLILSNNYICHFLVLKSELMKKLSFRREYDGAQDYDLVLRAAGILKEDERQIGHISKVLYHWRCHTGSTAENPQSKLYAYEAGKRALQSFADEQKYNAEAKDMKHLGFYRLVYRDDIFKCRQDIGAVGGRVVCKGRTVGGRMDMSGKIYYEGMSKHYSGYMNRAVLPQDAEAIDIRCIRVRPKLHDLFREITGISYAEDGNGLFDITLLPENCDTKRLSLKLSKVIRDKGYRILYSPIDYNCEV